jgi:hypothetical protein
MGLEGGIKRGKERSEIILRRVAGNERPQLEKT